MTGHVGKFIKNRPRSALLALAYRSVTARTNSSCVDMLIRLILAPDR